MICCFCCFVCFVCVVCVVCIVFIHTNNNRHRKFFFLFFLFFSFASFLCFFVFSFFFHLPPRKIIIRPYMSKFVPSFSHLFLRFFYSFSTVFLRPVYETIYVILCESPFLKKWLSRSLQKLSILIINYYFHINVALVLKMPSPLGEGVTVGDGWGVKYIYKFS